MDAIGLVLTTEFAVATRPRPAELRRGSPDCVGDAPPFIAIGIGFGRGRFGRASAWRSGRQWVNTLGIRQTSAIPTQETITRGGNRATGAMDLR